ncbi:MAG: hypothetical protein ABI076_03780 [Acidobacteriaceae bacterium]
MVRRASTFLVLLVAALTAHAQLYCPTGMAYLGPQGGGRAFCQAPTVQGIGAPSGTCTQNSVYLQQDTAGLYYCRAGSWTSIGTGGGGGMIYPPAGIPNSTGSAWSTSFIAPVGALVGTTDTQSLSNKTLDGVTPTIMSYVDPTSSIQTQLNNKQTALGYSPAHSGANYDITSLNAMTSPLAVAYGGNGSTSPGLVAGTNITLAGSWPNQIISSTAGGGGGGGAANVSVSIPSFAIPAGACYGSSGSSSPATVAMAGLSSTALIVAGYTGSPTAIVGWGTSGGLELKAWPSAPNTASYCVNNPTGSSITGGAITLRLGQLGSTSGGGVADVNLAVPTFTIPANSCYGSSGSTSPASVTISGLTTTMVVTAGNGGNPSSITGWGTVGGLELKIWPSAPNTASYCVNNPTASPITGGAITIILGAQ